MNCRLVSPAYPSVMNSSRPYPTSIQTLRSFTASSTSRPLCLPFSPIPWPWFSNSLTAYSRMSAYGAKESDGCDDDDVAARLLQRADHPVHLGRVPGVDDAGEIVDRLRELGEILGGGARRKQQGQAADQHAEPPG